MTKLVFFKSARDFPIGHISVTKTGQKIKKVAPGKWVQISEKRENKNVQGLTIKNGFYFDGKTKITNDYEKAKKYIQKKEENKPAFQKKENKNISIGDTIRVKANAKKDGIRETKGRGIVAKVKEIKDGIVKIIDDTGRMFQVQQSSLEFAKSGIIVNYFDLIKSEELKIGIKVEKEHANTVKKIKDKNLNEHESAKLIAKDHIKEAKDKGYDYYKRLLVMENLEDYKGIDKKIIEYIKSNNFIKDEKGIHEFAKKLKINQHKLEERIYAILKDVVGNKIKKSSNFVFSLFKSRDDKLEKLKKFLIKILENNVEKSLVFGFFDLIKAGKGYSVGTIRSWKEKKFIKVSPGKWRRFYEGESRGQKQSISYIKKQIEKADSISELAKIVFENRKRFTNLDGSYHKIVNQLLELAKNKKKDKKNGKIRTTNNTGRSYVDGGKKNGKEQKTLSKSEIKTVRSDITQRAKSNEIPEDIGRNLNKHQKDAINLILENYKKNKGFLLADGTGVGKTRQEIALAKIQLDKNKKTLIVTENKRIIEDAFKKDAKPFNIDLNYIENKENINDKKINITTYDKLKNISEESFDQIIFDESHNLKNYTSQKTKNGLNLIKKSKNVLLATATPLDKPEHVGYIASGLGLNYFKVMKDLGQKEKEVNIGYGKTIKVFEREVSKLEELYRIGNFFDKLTNYGNMIKREVSMDNVNLNIIDIDVSKKEKEIFDNLYEKFENHISSVPKKEKGIATATGLMALRRVNEDFKINKALNEIENDIKNGKKVVLFATRVNKSDISFGGEKKVNSFESEGVLNKINEELEKKGIKVSKLYKHDNKSKEVREKKSKEAIDKFQNGDNQVIITTPQSGGTGLNLDDSKGNSPRSVIVLTPPFSANDVVQMLGRVNRLTTKSKVDAKLIYIKNNPVEDWNKGIINTKLKRLGASSKGDYENIILDNKIDNGLIDNLSDSEIKNITKNNIALPENQDFVMESLNKINPNYKEKKEKVEYIKNIDHFISILPKKENGKIDFSKPLPNPKYNFGKNKGKTINSDLSYLKWVFSTAGYYNIDFNKINFLKSFKIIFRVNKNLLLKTVAGIEKYYNKIYGPGSYSKIPVSKKTKESEKKFDINVSPKERSEYLSSEDHERYVKAKKKLANYAGTNTHYGKGIVSQVKKKLKNKKEYMKNQKDKKFEKVMREFYDGKLKDSSGKLVTDKKRAIAIAFSESGK